MSGLYTRLVSDLLFPLHERLKHHDSVALRRGLEDSQWWPRERIEALQLDRLRALTLERVALRRQLDNFRLNPTNPAVQADPVRT